MRMKKQFVLLASLMIACGAPMALTSNQNLSGFTAIAQSNSKVTGTVTDLNGEPLIGATVMVKGTKMGTAGRQVLYQGCTRQHISGHLHWLKAY